MHEGKNKHIAKVNKAQEPDEYEQVANLDFTSTLLEFNTSQSFVPHLCIFIPSLTGMSFKTTV